MRRWGRLLEGALVSFSLLAGPLAAMLLALAAYARLAALLVALSLLLAGHFLRRLAQRRHRKSDLEELQPEIEAEQGTGRLCVAIGAVLCLLALIVPPWATVVAGLLGTGLAAIRGLGAIGDSAYRESRLKIGNLSPADECPHIEIWARRIAALPGSLPARLGRMANHVPDPGKIRGARLATLALVAGALLAYAGIAAALVYKHASSPPPEVGSGHSADDQSAAAGTAEEVGEPTPPDPDPTYEDECPDLPNPLDIGHGLGELFRFDGAFKAGCGTEAQQVPATGAWFARGICAGALRSLAVAGADGDRAILYGAAAEFALHAAQSGELVSAEEARPAGGDVYIVETSGGPYGFARQAATSGSGEGEVRDCTEVTETDRPFAELNAPMLSLWRELVQRRAVWSWPTREDVPGDSLSFASRSDGEIVAHGVCPTEFSCYLEVGSERWTSEETSHDSVALAEFEPYVPSPPR